jgi:hypothetical protein
MGCGCNKTSTKKEKLSAVSRVKSTVKTIWQSASQSDKPTHVVKRINNKK